MEAIAWIPNLTAQRAAQHDVTYVGKEEMFERADVVTIHMPLKDVTVGIVGAPEIARMKEAAYLINTSRSELIAYEPLLAALQCRRIGGLGVDVFASEPLQPDHPYRTLPNVIATPHLGFVTEENYELIFRQSFENLTAFLAGTPIRTITAAMPYLEGSQVARQRGQAD